MSDLKIHNPISDIRNEFVGFSLTHIPSFFGPSLTDSHQALA